ncbi:MAG: endonuclease/exonuclease/phosphatase family protein [Bryobacteraceae bacterium]|nr:endonuclease/exonuclease/phosphatase family protein [Bryobacteraceae bacterium]
MKQAWLFLVLSALPMAAQISLTGPYTENFNTLANAGVPVATPVPAGWAFLEAGTSASVNGLYRIGTGSDNAGDTYSFGAAASTDRAFGFLTSGTASPLRIGAFFQNNTGTPLSSVQLSYTGEIWRRGSNAADKAVFEFSTDATALNNGTWTAVTALDLAPPATCQGGTDGLRDGNSADCRVTLSASVPVTVAAGGTFWIRWTDTDVSSTDFGMGIDDVTVTPPAGGLVLSVQNVSVTEGNAGFTNVVFQVNLSAPAGPSGVTFTANTANVTATAGADYVAVSGFAGVIGPGSAGTTVTVQVIGDVEDEIDETFTLNLTGITGATPSSVSATGTITDDDVPAVSCVVTHTISQVQGTAQASTLDGQAVTVSGIVTARTTAGFFLQEPVVNAASLASQGIFVFTSSAPFAAATVGNSVCVSGTVDEFQRSSDTSPLTVTEIVSPTVSELSTGNALPAAVELTAANLAVNGAIDQLERYEGMRVRIANAVTIAPTRGFGETWITATTASRPFREAGISPLEPAVVGLCPQTSQQNPGQTGCIPRWDGNPEKVMLDSDGLAGLPSRNYATGAVVGEVLGPLHYDFSTYRILPETAVPDIAAPAETALAVAPAGQLTVASFNVENFFDTVNDPATDDTVLSATNFNTKRDKLAAAIRTVLRNPDVIGLQEVENQTVLDAVAAAVNAANGGSTNYVGYVEPGNDPRGINTALLVNTNRVTVTSVQQLNKAETFVCGAPPVSGTLNDRPPLVLKGSIANGGALPLAFTVVVNHLRSLGGIAETGPADPAVCPGQTEGERVRLKRQKQAESLASLVQTLQAAGERVIVLGDMNAFEFSDGYGDLLGTIKGTPRPANEVVQAAVAGLVNPPLVNLVEGVPAGQRYSYSFDGSAQVLDHVLVTQGLTGRVQSFEWARMDADFPETLRNNAATPRRLSDHDPARLALQLPTATAVGGATITRTGMLFNPIRQQWQVTLRVRNNTGAVLALPLRVALRNLTAGVTVVNAAGSTDLFGGSTPYVNLPQAIAPAATVSVTVYLTAPPNTTINFAETLYQGTF